MDRLFKSKVGWWYHLTIAIVAVITVICFLNPKPLGIIISLLVLMFLVHTLVNTWYKITADGMLIAHCSIFPEKKIAISEIEALTPSHMPISSYALSLDRLIVVTHGKMWLFISPKDQAGFVKALRGFNPDIKWKEESY